MSHDIMNVKAVIDERRRMASHVDLGSEACLAVRREVEDASWVEGHSEGRKSRSWFARLRQLNLNGRAESSKHQGPA